MDMSKLKVPPNCPEPHREDIESALRIGPTERHAPVWVQDCAVAAMYWRKCSDDKLKEYEAKHANDPVEVRPRNIGKVTGLAEAYTKWSNDPLIVESRAAIQQADLWQQAAFWEGE